MNKYIIFKRFGNGHESIVNEIEAETAKDAFKLAVNKYLQIEHYVKYTAFYVRRKETFGPYFDDKIYSTIDDMEGGYGYDSQKAYNKSKGFYSVIKELMDSVYEK